MPSKQRLHKDSWTKCQNCNITFVSETFPFHENNECLLQRNQQVLQAIQSSSSTNNKLAFMIDFNFYTYPFLIQDEIEAQIRKRFSSDVLLIHPDSLCACQFELGQYVQLNNYSCVIWTSNKIPIYNLGVTKKLMDKFKLHLNRQTTITRINGPYDKAIYLKYKLRTDSSLLESEKLHDLFHYYYDNCLFKQGNSFTLNFYGKQVEADILKIYGSKENMRETSLCDKIESLDIDSHQNYSQFYYINTDTKFECWKRKEIKSDLNSNISLDQVGGLNSQIDSITNIIKLGMSMTHSLQHDSTFLNLQTPRGVLLYGPSGCGKSFLCKALFSKYKEISLRLNPSDIWSKFYGESEKKLQQFFIKASTNSPCLLFIDDLDILVPKHHNSTTDLEKRVSSTLLMCIDEALSLKEKILIIVATCKNREDLDPAIRRPGRIDREIEIGVPNPQERHSILEKLLSSTNHILLKNEIEDIASKAHGFTGADLAAVCKEASLQLLSSEKKSEGQYSMDRLQLAYSHLLHGLSSVQPSAMREVTLEIPNVTWDDIGGQGLLKLKLKQAIEWPLKHPEAFNRLGINPPRGLLMYGPPGCSKTMIARALANESGLNFLAIKGPELFSKWVGESEKAVRKLFHRARLSAPSIIFFDEIDALASERSSKDSGSGSNVSDRVLAQLLTEIDGVEALNGVTIVAATNRPDLIDKALMRPGRLDRIIFVPLPDTKTRKEIFNIRFRKMPVSADVDVDNLVIKTEKFSGAEITALCHEAALCALQENIDIKTVSKSHFESAFTVVSPRTSDTLLKFYDEYTHRNSLHSL